MTITSGSNKLASDFNSIAGPINASAPYASSAAATNMVAALYGVGFGDRGYGQFAPVLSKKTVGNPNELLWLCTPSGDGQGDGGWNTLRFAIDNTKKHRSAVWFRIKTSDVNGGRFYHGLDGAGNTLALTAQGGAVDNNPYWHYPAAIDLPVDQWYLSIGILHEAGYAGANTGLSGIYDIHGNKVIASNDYRLAAGATQQQQRVYHYYDTTTTEREWLARPRWEVITGSEPSIATLVSAPWESVSADTMITPSQWVKGTTGTQGVFINNDSVAGESSIVQANEGTNVPGPTGSIVKGQDFIDIRTALATMATFQGTSQATLPAASVFAAGQNINAANEAALATFAATIDTNRFLTNGGASMSATPAVLTVTRGTTWGAGANQIACIITATFPSEDATRYFFNTGGSIDLVLAHPSTASSQDSNWNTVLTALGTVSLTAKSTTRSGSGGTPQALGFYNLTGAYQTIFQGTLGTGAYSTNAVTVEALVTGVGGVHGGNGNVVTFRVTLNDAHTNAFSDLVQAGTNAKFGYKKVAVSLSTALISVPTFATVTNF